MRAPLLAAALFIAALPALAGSWTTGTYVYDGSGNITSIGTDVYRYDAFGRLKISTARTPANANAQTFTYDPYGNLKLIETVGGVPLYMPVNPATNHIDGTDTPPPGSTVVSATYDEAGNQTSLNGAYTYTYDALGMMATLTSGSRVEQYLYDADDQRIATAYGGTPQRWRYTLRDLDGRFVREYVDEVNGQTHSWRWTRDYLYADGRLFATIVASDRPGGESRHHFHLDHLGTPRLITEDGGNLLARHTLQPFGPEAIGSTRDSEVIKLTGHERDYAVAGDTNDLDYMHARYYSPASGRFLSVDPVNSASPNTPQSWGRYSYARNNPMALVDRNGKWPTKVVHTHQNAIDFTLRTLPGSDRQILRQAQVTADLDQRNQYKHAMRNPGQSPHDAAILANQFIDTAMDRAVALEKAGNHAGALLNVGLAMHTLQDNTSPMHMGVQEFDPNKGNLSGATLAHVQGELYDPSGIPQHEGVGENLDRATYDAYAHFANATGLPVPPVPQCDGKPCFEPSGEIHVEVPPK
jgi:RHS repeat-associated protein